MEPGTGCRAAAKAAEHQAAKQCLVCMSTASPVKELQGCAMRGGEERRGEKRRRETFRRCVIMQLESTPSSFSGIANEFCEEWTYPHAFRVVED